MTDPNVLRRLDEIERLLERLRKVDVVTAAAGTLTVEDEDGSPSVSSVDTIVVPNGSLTDDGGGQVSIDFLSAIQTGAAGVLFNHFFNSILGTAGGGNGGLEFNMNLSGGYTADPITPPSTDAIGVVGIRSNAASGAASGAIYTSGPGTFLTIPFGGVALDLTWRFRINALPASGQDYQIVLGFTDARSVTPANGAFLFLDFAAGFTDFRYRTRAGGSQTDVGSGLTAAANTWYRLRIQINAAGTEATFTINGASSQTLSTNVPNGTGQTVSLMAYSNRISGTNDRILYLDYVRFAWSEGPS